MRKNFDGDTRITYIEQIEDGEKSVPEVARELGVAEDLIHKWRRQLTNDTDPGSSRRSAKAFRHPRQEWY